MSTTIYRAETTGGKYAIEVTEEEDGTFSIRGYVNGAPQSASVGWKTLEEVGANVFRNIRQYRTFDNIHLRVVKQDVHSWGSALYDS